MTFIILTLVGYLTGKLFAYKGYKLQMKIIKKTPLREFHFHHSFAGILIILVGFLIVPPYLKASVVGFGSGLSLHHFLTEGFQFITFK